MRDHRLLFSAPIDFSPDVMERYREVFDMDSTGQPEIIVCDPKAAFVIDDNYLQMFPKLRILATPSTGTNHIDLDACKRRNVKVISLLDDRVRLEQISASAEYTFKLLLDAFRIPPAVELQGKYVGIIGMGRIGKRIANWCLAFRAFIEANDPYVRKFQDTPLHKIFKECDAVVVCCALNGGSKGMINERLLRSMKVGAALVNTARGEIIDEEALVKVMAERPDLRVALDVVVGEVNGTADRDRLRKLGAIVSNHIAGETYDSRSKAALIILRLLERECYE